MANLNSHELLRLVESGDSQAAATVFDRYVARLLALVRKRIGPKLGRRIDADDVVQSAYRSFFVHAENEEYMLSRAGDLWRLLASIALNKLHGQIERNTALRRTIERESPGNSVDIKAATAPEPTPAELVAIAEQLHLFHASLSPAEQAMLTACLQGQSVDEIAAHAAKSPRTVRRILAQLRKRLEQRLADETTSTHDAPQRQAHADARAPFPYADLTIEQLVGAGGMGKVYRATRRSTGDKVAVKALLKSRHGDPLAVEKFLQEAQILARLRHPNIVGVQGVGRFPGGGYFIVMELVNGVDFQTRIAAGPLAPAEAVQVVRQTATAIDYAHQQGIVHGDLKPANVLRDASQRVVVSDFGLAQFIVGGRGARPPQWIVGGTVGYMAPEVRDRGAATTTLADVFGLGALLSALVHGNAPSPAGVPESGLEKLDAVIRTCLADAPQDRYRSVADLRAELDRIDARL